MDCGMQKGPFWQWARAENSVGASSALWTGVRCAWWGSCRLPAWGVGFLGALTGASVHCPGNIFSQAWGAGASDFHVSVVQASAGGAKMQIYLCT